MKYVWIFDLDGTLADNSHRMWCIEGEKKDWDSFFDLCENDKPIEHMLDLAWHLQESYDGVLIVSGRSNQVREKTEQWLSDVGLCDFVGLYMRQEGDHRNDDIVKRELLDELRADGYEPIMVFDDRKRVVDMWRAEGIPCAQVAEGDF